MNNKDTLLLESLEAYPRATLASKVLSKPVLY